MVYTKLDQDTAAEADVKKAVDLGATREALNKRIDIFKMPSTTTLSKIA